MSLNDYKITDASISQKGVVAAPDKLTGSAQENKKLFDRLIREVVKGMFNALIDELVSLEGARSIGALQSMSSGDATVQGQLTALATRISAAITSAELTSALSYKADSSVVSKHFKNVDLNTSTGVFTFEREDGTKVTFDTALEKIAINFVYDPSSQALKLTLSDGTQQSIPLSSFITETEFSSSTTVSFSVANGKVSATIPLGSITDEHLSSVLRARLVEYVNAAAASALEAKGHAQSASDSAALAKSQSTAAAGSASSASRDAAQALTSKSGADNAAERAEKAAKKAEAAAGGVITDQTYDPQSSNAQSGTAVAEALRTVEVETEAQDVSNGYKTRKSVMGYIYEGAVKITDSAPVRHKAYFSRPNVHSGITAYVIPMNFAPASGVIEEKVEIPVFPSSNNTLYVDGVSFDSDGYQNIGKLWELVDANNNVISSGVFSINLISTTIQLTNNSDKLVIYSSNTRESSVGVTSSIDWISLSITETDNRYPRRDIIKSSEWVYKDGEYRNYVESIDQESYYVWCSASESTYHYNADINTIIGGGGSDVTFTSGTITIPASGWSPFSTSNYSHTYDYGNTCFTCPVDKSVKLAIVDIADGATIAQRKAAEQACIYGYYYMLGGPDMGMDRYDGFLSFGITSETVPSVDIPVKYTVIVG